MTELETDYQRIRQIQVRVRRKSGGSTSALPGEDDQLLVFLEKVTGYFFVPVKNTTNRDLELEMIGVLREAFFQGKSAKLGYQEADGNRYISAVWVRA